VAIILSNLNRFAIFSHKDSSDEFALKWLLKITPHLAYVATLPCETLMSDNKQFHDKL